MKLISHPFRVAASGHVVTAEQGSDQSSAEMIAVLVLTIRGERPLVPLFGIPDPVFSVLAAADVQAGISMFGPDVTIGDVEVTEQGPAQRVEVTYGQ